MKKIVTLLCMLACVLGLTACGEDPTTLSLYNTDKVSTIAQSAAGIVAQEYPEEDLAKIKTYDADTWETIQSDWKTNYGLKMGKKVTLAGIESYLSAVEDIGTTESYTGMTFKEDEDSVEAILQMTGSLHDYKIDVLMDSDLNVTSVSVNVDYSFGEKMGKAGLNTLMGLGTVFLVLILIYFIISRFKYIASMEKYFAKRAENRRVKKAAKLAKKNGIDTTIAQIIEKEEEELSDDTELVAVIAAAIASYEGTSTDGFVVRSIRKANANKWRNSCK